HFTFSNRTAGARQGKCRAALERDTGMREQSMLKINNQRQSRKLFIGNRRSPAAVIVEDDTWPNQWRIVRPDGSLSDHVNASSDISTSSSFRSCVSLKRASGNCSRSGQRPTPERRGE